MQIKISQFWGLIRFCSARTTTTRTIRTKESLIGQQWYASIKFLQFRNRLLVLFPPILAHLCLVQSVVESDKWSQKMNRMDIWGRCNDVGQLTTFFKIQSKIRLICPYCARNRFFSRYALYHTAIFTNKFN